MASKESGFVYILTNPSIRDNREFFNIKPEVALDIFKEVATLIDDAEIEGYIENNF